MHPFVAIELHAKLIRGLHASGRNEMVDDQRPPNDALTQSQLSRSNPGRSREEISSQCYTLCNGSIRSPEAHVSW